MTRYAVTLKNRQGSTHTVEVVADHTREAQRLAERFAHGTRAVRILLA